MSGLNLRCRISTRPEHFQMTPSLNMWSTESKGVITYFSRPMSWAESQPNSVIWDTTGAFVPLPVIHLLLERHCSRPAIKLTGTSLFCMWLFDTTQQAVALWPGGKSSSIAVAALALITHTPAHYSSPWGDADRGTRASIWSTSAHSVEVAIHGLFTDGLLKKPLVEQCGMLRQ